MDNTTKKAANIDAYIADFPAEVQELLQAVRQCIQAAAPDAKEAISYGIPTFVLNGNLVHFAAFKQHIGFYPAPSGAAAFAEALSKFKTGKGSVQFPINEPMPFELIRQIVAYRVEENQSKKQRKK